MQGLQGTWQQAGRGVEGQANEARVQQMYQDGMMCVSLADLLYWQSRLQSPAAYCILWCNGGLEGAVGSDEFRL